MKILKLRPSSRAVIYMPRRIPQLSPSPWGLDLSFGIYRDVPFADLQLLAVFALKDGLHSQTNVLFFITGEKRPFMIDGSRIAFSQFPVDKGVSLHDTLRRFLHYLCQQNPQLPLPEETAAFLRGQPPAEVPKPRLHELTGSLALAVQTEPLEAGAAPMPEKDSAASKLPKEVFAARANRAEPDPPSLLPPWNLTLPYGSRRSTELIKGFCGEVTSPDTSENRLRALLLIALVILLLPLAYLSVIGAIAYGVTSFAVNNWPYIRYATSGQAVAPTPVMLDHIVPIVFGVVVLISFLVPLFLYPPRTPQASMMLAKEQENVLFCFIGHLCRAIGAPVPRLIAVDCQIDISVRSKSYGYHENDLTLTLGLPLVAGLTLEQFAGLVANRLVGSVRGSKHWLSRWIFSKREEVTAVICRIDGWHHAMISNVTESLRNAEHSLPVRILGNLLLVSIYLMWVVVVLPLRIARCIAKVLHGLELEEDRCEKKLVGGEVFDSARRDWARLRAAHEKVLAGLSAMRRRGQLPEHLPAIVVVQTLELRKSQANSAPVSRSDKSPPVFRSQLPATALFRDFSALSTKLTRDCLGLALGQLDPIEPLESYLSRQCDNAAERRALKRYFGCHISSWRPLPLPAELASGGHSREKMADLLRSRQAMFAKLDTFRDLGRQFEMAAARRLSAREARQLIAAGFRPEANAFGLDRWDQAAAQDLEKEAEVRLNLLAPTLEQYDTLAGQRLLAALRLTAIPKHAIGSCNSLRGPIDSFDISGLLAAVAQINDAFEPLLDLRLRCAVLATVKRQIALHPENAERATVLLDRGISALQVPIEMIYERLETTFDLFYQSRRDLGLSIRGLPNNYLDLGQEVLNRVYALYFRSLARLAYMAEQIESMAGLEPLPHARWLVPVETKTYKPEAKLNETMSIQRDNRAGRQLRSGDFLLNGRLKLLEPIGRGGFATVWKAYDQHGEQLVALKILHEQFADDRSRRRRFFRGARIMKSLQHPGIVQVIEDQCEDQGHFFFVMEYVNGGDLKQAILARDLTLEECLQIILEVGAALRFAHQSGLLHRDVKPANILMDRQGLPKLTDFDLARALDISGGRHAGAMRGTFPYSAPDGAANESADVFSLGMTAVFAIWGADPPFDVLREPGSFVSRLRCSDAIKSTLLKAVSWDGNRRFPSVADFCSALGRAAFPVATHDLDRAPVVAFDDTPAVLCENGTGSVPTAAKQSSLVPTRALLFVSLIVLAISIFIPFAPRLGILTREQINRKDGSVLVYVPGGEFTFGFDHQRPSNSSRRVTLSPFWIGKYPVTNEQYSTFLRSNPPFPAPMFWEDKDFNAAQQPVVGVAWREARAYCDWAGLTLPTEAQWETAARGTDERRYPWGNSPPQPKYADFGRRTGGPTPAGVHPAGVGPYGTMDQVGNVAEWCADVWIPRRYWHKEGELDAAELYAVARWQRRAIRGGSWRDSSYRLLAAARQHWPQSLKGERVGFRCLLPTRTDRVPAEGSGVAKIHERRHTKDGSILVYVPGGEYTLGADIPRTGDPGLGKHPMLVHRVRLSPFWIGKHPVTNGQYLQFLNGNPGSPEPAYWNDKDLNDREQPVVGVSWEEASEYCQWAGLVLPTEAQWEAAARGTDQRRYAWGNSEPIPERRYFGYRNSPVGAYPAGAGPYGTLDQTGNVREWCADVWNRKAHEGREGALDPISTRGEYRLRPLRGRSSRDRYGYLWGRPAAYRIGERIGARRKQDIGFRCLLPGGSDQVELSVAAKPGSDSNAAVGNNTIEIRERKHARDGSILVYVPGGEYSLGANDLGRADDQGWSAPVHRVRLSPFWIGKYPVTNEQFKQFLEAHPGHPEPRFWRNGRELRQEFTGPRQPVVGVSWAVARSYCQWAGLVLPSEAQWEAAARGTDQRRYPWGNSKPRWVHGHFEDLKGNPTPVDAYPLGAGPYGTLDQAGNVAEWCADVWDPRAYEGRNGALDPVARNGNRDIRVQRGGSYFASPEGVAVARRTWSYSLSRSKYVGFRCLLPLGQRVPLDEPPSERTTRKMTRSAGTSTGPRSDDTLEELSVPVSSEVSAVLGMKETGVEPGSEATGIRERINAKDGSVLVFVPGGEYTLGSDEGRWHSKRVHRVRLSPFWIGKYPVTGEQYERYLDAHGWQRRRQSDVGPFWTGPRNPVVKVRWMKARDYCQWAGLALPTEAQWEAAARGADQRRYPWGNGEARPEHMRVRKNFMDPTVPVDAYPGGAGPFGTVGQIGNVAEWCEDVWYDNPKMVPDGELDPVGSIGEPAVRSVRGGRWDVRPLPVYYREAKGIEIVSYYVGFRCVLPAGNEP